MPENATKVKKYTIIELLSKRSAEGDAWSSLVLGLYYFKGVSVGQSNDEALRYLNVASTQATDKSLLETISKIAERRIKLGKKWDKVECDYKSEPPWYIEIIIERYEKAVLFLEAAAKQSDASALFCLARMYEYGEGVKRSRKKFLELLEQASRQDYGPAECMLGIRLYNKAKTYEEKSRGIQLLEKSVDDTREDTWKWSDFPFCENTSRVDAEVVLGDVYLDKKSGFYDSHHALRHFVKAASLGSIVGWKKVVPLLEGEHALPSDIVLSEKFCQKTLVEALDRASLVDQLLSARAVLKLREYAALVRCEINGEIRIEPGVDRSDKR